MTTVKKQIIKLKIPIFMQVLFSFLATGAMALIPVYHKWLVDKVLPQGGRGFLALAILYLATYLFFLLTTWIAERFIWRCAICFENQMKKYCFDKMLRLPRKAENDKKSGEYLSILTNHILSIEQDYLTPLTGVIKDFIAVAVYVVVIAVSTSPLICVLLVVLSLAATFSPGIYKKRLQETGKKYVDEAADYTKHTQDLLGGFDMIDIKTKNSFSKANLIYTDRLSEKRRLMGHAKVNGNTISGGAVYIIGVVIFFVCGYLMLEGDISAGTVLAALSYVEVFSDPLEDILYGVNMLHSTKDVVKSLDEFLSSEEAEEGDTASIAMIECRNIKVVFPTKELRYDLKFEKGNKYVLHGESGAGKSTLLQVMMGRVSYSGDLLINGKAQAISVDQCSYMSQQQHIYMEDFETNVTLFQAYPTLEECYRKMLDAATPYERAKNTLDCSCLSGGEQQIVKFCRMLAQKKELLLLDEPFSAMDRKNAELLIAILNELPATILLVTHDKDMKGLENWCVIEL